MPAKDEKSTTAQKNDSSEKKPKDGDDKSKDKKQSEDNQFEDDDDFEEFPVNKPDDVKLPPEFETEEVVSEECLFSSMSFYHPLCIGECVGGELGRRR